MHEAESDATTERELKLTPLGAGVELLERLQGSDLERLGSLSVEGPRLERQHNAFFDTAGGHLRAARLGFRRRVVEGQRGATWSLKGPGAWSDGVMARPEVEVQLAEDTPPLMALAVLGQAARERGALALAERLADARAGAPPPLARPYLEFSTERVVRELRSAAGEAELALDRVTLACGHTQLEIEVELRRGDAAILAEARAAIEAQGGVEPSRASKLARALEHAQQCTSSSQKPGF